MKTVFVPFIKFVKNILRPLNIIKRNITSNRKIILQFLIKWKNCC